MPLLATPVVFVSQPELPRGPSAATAQARATVRVVSGARVHFGGRISDGAPLVRVTRVRLPETELQPARLIEFE